jgi:hypothetical protein
MEIVHEYGGAKIRIATAYVFCYSCQSGERRSEWTGREAQNRLVTATAINLWIPGLGEMNPGLPEGDKSHWMGE